MPGYSFQNLKKKTSGIWQIEKLVHKVWFQVFQTLNGISLGYKMDTLAYKDKNNRLLNTFFNKNNNWLPKLSSGKKHTSIFAKKSLA